MAKGIIDFIDLMGKNTSNISISSQKALQKELEARNKLRLRYDKDYDKLSYKEQEAYNKRLNKMLQKSKKEQLEDTLEILKAEYDSALTWQEKLSASWKSSVASWKSDIGQSAINNLKKIGSAIGNSITSGIDSYISTYGQYMSAISTRLQGSTKSYQSITDIFARNTATSPYVSQTKLLENLNTLVAQGISYNVEQRAFLATVSDRIASTFDVANGTLLRLIRIQQADSTAARLGLESTLNKFLNSMFQDTSYLGSMSQSVSSAIIDANSQLSRDQSVAFEYQLQKWLGSLSSVGVSESTISMLAQGVGYLGSGNVSALSSNQSLQNLLIMAANASGLDYASMLTRGMNATDVNRLMQGVVKYGQQIASTNNQVVKSQYAQLFGMTISDLTSLMNLSAKDMENIAKSMLSYQQAISETEKGLSTIHQRMTFKEQMDNVISNIMGAVGSSIANNAGAYVTYTLNKAVMEATGGGIEVPIPIPFVGVYNLNLNKAVQTGLVGYGLLAQAGNILSGIASGGRLSLRNWGAQETTGRGSGLTSNISDFAHTLSASMYVGSNDSSAVKETSIASSQQEAQQVSGSATDEQSETFRVIREDINENVASIRTTLNNIYELMNNFAIRGGFPA